MAKFNLIQRGTFNKPDKSLTGPFDILRFSYMGSAEFEFGALPKAYRRLMYHFEEYDVFHTEIYTPEHEELMVFCRKDWAVEVIQAIREFIEQPYRLKEYSELEKVPKAKKGDTTYDGRHSDFWWCIDIGKSYGRIGDWMAFLQPQSNLLIEALENSYLDWWLNLVPEVREEEYKNSLRW